jgi:hypothetical protein
VKTRVFVEVLSVEEMFFIDSQDLQASMTFFYWTSDVSVLFY